MDFRVLSAGDLELYFLEDTATPILQTDASDYGIGGYVFMVTNGKVTSSKAAQWLSERSA